MPGSRVIRSFVAVDCRAGEEMLSALARWKEMLAGERIKWAETGKMHLTLSFFGDIDEGKVQPLRTGLREVLEGSGGFSIRLSGIGIFGKASDPRVIWVGIEPDHRLIRIRDQVDRVAGMNGIHPDPKPFHPHITLGRPKQIRNPLVLHELLSGYREKFFQEVEVSEVILYESRLRSEGSEYITLERIPLT